MAGGVRSKPVTLVSADTPGLEILVGQPVRLLADSSRLHFLRYPGRLRRHAFGNQPLPGRTP